MWWSRLSRCIGTSSCPLRASPSCSNVMALPLTIVALALAAFESLTRPEEHDDDGPVHQQLKGTCRRRVQDLCWTRRAYEEERRDAGDHRVDGFVRAMRVEQVGQLDRCREEKTDADAS